MNIVDYNLNRFNDRIGCPCNLPLTKDIDPTGEDITALSEELLDSLRLLNYDKDYAQKYSPTDKEEARQ